MKRISMILIIIISSLIMTSCDIGNMEISENIEAPMNLNLPLYGEWVIEDYKFSTIGTMDEEKANSYIGSEVIFDNRMVSIGENYCLEPTFKIKNVDASKYLVYNYKTNPEFLGIDSEDIQIVSVSGIDQFFNEFIKLSDEKAIVNIDGVFFYLNRVSEHVDEEKIDKLSVPQEISLKSEKANDNTEQQLSSGILLGLKTLSMEGEEQLETWNYRTVFIRSSNKEIKSINEMEDILLPRRNGFWKVKVNRESVKGNLNDNIEVYQLDRVTDMKVELQMEGEDSVKDFKEKIEEKDSTLKNILFVGNDYISIEDIHYRNKGQRYLKFYPIDNINGIPIKISDLMGDAGKKALVEGFNKEIVSQNEAYRSNYVDLTPKEDSFGLFRRNGLWIFKGRVNYIEDGVYMYKDFNINALPTQELVSFDELYIPWNVVKEKFPRALDLFTSPNGDIAVVLTYDRILVYEIANGTIGDEPIGEVELKPGEKIIMAEWAVGKYAQIWEEEFKNN